MGTYTFSSQEILNQAQRIRTQSSDLQNEGLYQIRDFARQISNYVRSEDSSLAHSWSQVADAAELAGNKIVNYGEALAAALENYAKKTVELETEKATSTSESGDDIVSALAGLEDIQTHPYGAGSAQQFTRGNVTPNSLK